MEKEKIKELLAAMSHAFYSVHDCLEENLPDCGGEYEDDCMDIYENSLAEFKKAEEGIKKLLCVEK